MLSSSGTDQSTALNIAIIGGGPTGLCSARHCIARGYNVTIFEQNEDIGGTWLYTDEVGKDKYGLKIHSAMYKELRANGPTQTMEYPDLHYPNDTLSYPPYPDVLNYLLSYADLFQLRKYVKFSHLVVRVHPIDGDKWEVIVKDLPNDSYSTRIFDAIFVCNGHFSEPLIPEIDGVNEFKEKLMHSHDFRSAEVFRDEDVLIIGAGTSGCDLVIHLSRIAKTVTLSRRHKPKETEEMKSKFQNSLPEGIIVRDVVKRFTDEGAEFIDGTQMNFSTIIYATGYKYSFPFLSVDSGIHVDDNFVQPLYKQIINIEHPTMAFIGIPKSALNYNMFDMQVRFALKYLSGEKSLPTKQEMLLDQQVETEAHWKQGYPKRKTHLLYPMDRKYFDQLSNLTDIENVPDILDAIAMDQINDLIERPTEFRKYKFTIIDDKTYTKVRYED
ncbi:senecionine N-oxygenase-like isoform X2 [Bradysia coprophila]|uniref:senecionine N-oxygenase-like isoform X2 n=1 Tax=Bradysia coprophila TaxID=38358 RepID=UPI00187DB482|nr:senecionine N-oxygenase-like isoform X2 [Bradysia coprophila]